MKIAVMGAGAVGSYYGAVLARAGHDVIMIGRHVYAIAL
jgi:2-dehydropantoate 2-reductase